MPRTVTGAGRVTVLPLPHTWPDRYGVLAYTTSGEFGDTAIVGYVTIVDIPDMSLMDIAEQHQPARLCGSAAGARFTEACWLICVGWSGRTIPKPGTLELPHAAWSLEVDRTTELGMTMYGHDRLSVGRITLDDPDLMARAPGVLAPDSRIAASV
ncbi:hypothetical protein SSPS47_15615 [Streptomyces sp. S4.7]|uniref:hypothetical protein n=1 Tax=Streptomyces sp. S4.7 TaxID=2705439 RepID=UPI00139946CA|nr:hypothetical protein [Streptomyces sp. S4.7]QHY96543.1 hypothetical protein SSPS47_15615 [Streptomyces sp. S4.7]